MQNQFICAGCGDGLVNPRACIAVRNIHCNKITLHCSPECCILTLGYEELCGNHLRFHKEDIHSSYTREELGPWLDKIFFRGRLVNECE